MENESVLYFRLKLYVVSSATTDVSALQRTENRTWNFTVLVFFVKSRKWLLVWENLNFRSFRPSTNISCRVSVEGWVQSQSRITCCINAHLTDSSVKKMWSVSDLNSDQLQRSEKGNWSTIISKNLTLIGILIFVNKEQLSSQIITLNWGHVLLPDCHDTELKTMINGQRTQRQPENFIHSTPDTV